MIRSQLEEVRNDYKKAELVDRLDLRTHATAIHHRTYNWAVWR